MHIREERPGDHEAISRLHHAAFTNHPQHQPGAEPTEHLIVERLRHAGVLSLSLVAESRSIEGHLALSPARVGDAAQGWSMLGPVGVLPGHQGRGIGSALLAEAIRRMRARGALGIVLVGDPGFYGRFGFSSMPGLWHAGVPDQYVLALAFGAARPLGAIQSHAAFDAN